ncbi:hypothetical protein [Ramlibacter albus]|uniref:Uncharacterized protein n=1 Tax=Ramlibacter albus TaxID=2079448 RepID=A0A923S1G7_9BURK|nr:hypothetical protein [Ramlibacter albus]MBC5764270.1 hypothetical protein [Ramlibacter albus]
MKRISRNLAYFAATALTVTAFAVGWRYYDALATHPGDLEQTTPAPAMASTANNTAVLGSYGGTTPTPQPSSVLSLPGSGTALSANGFPRTPAPAGAEVEVAALPGGAALAVWTQDGHLRGSRYAPGAGWGAPQDVDTIRGEPSDLELAANANGEAMAVWRHTLGEIQSLRYARWQPASGWSPPEVIPGVLPRRLNSAVRPKLVMDNEGNVTLQWPSGFGGTSAQVTRYEAGRGWSAPQDVAAR